LKGDDEKGVREERQKDGKKGEGKEGTDSSGGGMSGKKRKLTLGKESTATRGKEGVKRGFKHKERVLVGWGQASYRKNISKPTDKKKNIVRIGKRGQEGTKRNEKKPRTQTTDKKGPKHSRNWRRPKGQRWNLSL